MLSANIFQIFEIHFKCVTRFSTKIFCIKISRNCTFLNTIYVPNREIRMPFKVLFTFHILSIFKTTQKYICILGKLTNKYKIVPNKKRVSVSFYCNYSIYWLFQLKHCRLKTIQRKLIVMKLQFNTTVVFFYCIVFQSVSKHIHIKAVFFRTAAKLILPNLSF